MIYTYQDLKLMFGIEHDMPPEEEMRGDVLEYRCPYTDMCPANANCFAVATPKPLQDDDILNVKCKLIGNKKIPIYAKYSALKNK